MLLRVHDPFLSRRKLIQVAGASIVLGAIDAFGLEPRWLRVTEHDLPVPKLPKILEGFQIAQITDAHLKRIGTVEKSIIHEIQRRQVQLVVLTGDIVEGPDRVALVQEFCRRLRGPGRTILATLGNWEHWGSVPVSFLQQSYLDCNVKLLVNEAVLVDSAVSVIATDDSTAGSVRINEAIAGRSASAVSLFLTHSPELLDRLPNSIGRFDLSLAGHTHGGQVRVGPIVPARPAGSGRFVSGWYDISVGKAYVSCGTGLSVIPARFACRPELPVFTLRQG